ncbi:MAG TPA: hypothetical protein VK897_02455 [Anaerolineales bacterium]|nr:hypothetical protein [Anaerolineales bacterium]
MKKTRASIERFLLSPAHPVLLSLYFVLRLYAENAHGIPTLDLIRPLFLSVLATGVFYLFFLRVVHIRHTAALMTSVLVLGFYLYTLGLAVLPLRKYMPAWTFASLWALVTVALIVLLAWKLRTPPHTEVIAGINLTAFILLLFPIIQLLDVTVSRSLVPAPRVRHAIHNALPSPSPDIYYIILDGYPRADVLRDAYAYDNSEFLQSLQDLGFYVAECSQSNYAITGLSLTSSLHLDYLQNLSDIFDPATVDFLGLFKYLDNNTVRESLSNMGYRTVSFASGFTWAEWRDADVFLAPPDGPMTEFEALLLQSTYANILDNTSVVDFEEKYAARFRARTQLVLDSFDRLADMPGPKLVFIHLIVPHPPFAFDENGNAVPAGLVDPENGFLDQVKFINKFLLPGLKTLVEKSATPPVIILQGDHGPILEGDLSAEVKILNAYYLPRGTQVLYPTITPVNSFRVVFNTYFGTSFPLIQDVSYYSDRVNRFDFLVIPNDCSP